MRHRIHREIWLVLAITFGMSGLRSLLRLIDATLSPVALNEQSTTLNSSQADSPWLDLALQLCGAGTLIAWGLLSLFLLAVNASEHRIPGPLLRLTSAKTWLTEIGWGALLALAIGVPGLAFYVTAVHLGLSKQVIPSSLETWWTIPVLLLYSFANAFAEEIVVVGWLSTRLRQLGKSTGFSLLACSLLRGSYHLYQGFSAGNRQYDYGSPLYLVLSQMAPTAYLATHRRAFPYRRRRFCWLLPHRWKSAVLGTLKVP
ncbi:CPBP family intramembrane metalloprotease [Corynebacterium pseudotuberculosis]|nr:CPBP family intramembrane metalloprotease [Corynebacterium pseudotuberculosis]